MPSMPSAQVIAAAERDILDELPLRRRRDRNAVHR